MIALGSPLSIAAMSAGGAAGLQVSQLANGGAGTESSPITETTTASIAIESGALIEVDIHTYPETAPDAVDFTITGLGLTFAQQYSVASSQYAQTLRYRAEAPADASGTLTLTADVNVSYIIYAVKQWTGQLQGNNGADAYIQTNGANSTNSTTLSAFASDSNQASATFVGTYFPTQSGTVDDSLTELAAFSYIPDVDYRMVTATGPDDSPYSITWANTPYQWAVMASEIAAG